MTIRVILAVDHDRFRQELASLLDADQGMQLLAQAKHGIEALNVIERLRPDVAVLDNSMPELTGIEVTRKTIGTSLGTRIVLLTMNDDPSAALEAQEAGVGAYILKDNAFEELVAAIRAVAAGKTFVTPVIQEKIAMFRLGR